LVLGCGSVAQCALPLMVRDLKFDPTSIHIVDFRDNRSRVAELLKAGVTYEQDRVTRENLDFQAVPKQRKRFGKQVIDAGNNHISTPCWIMMGLADVNSMYRFRMSE
jgi:homospermidine synthase